ncbi:MAG: PEP-CTERM sorting domain-containing protein [Planctomycetales bacterium]|nr:PEP-CTERM sorting domain-containing protein [Planctomycetales bacterium]
MNKLLAFVAVAVLATPALARELDVQQMDNGNGTTTFWISIDSLPEVSFLELDIHGKPGHVNQVDGGATYDAVSSSPWAPSVVFTSDALLAGALNPTYAAQAESDTVIADSNWPGKVQVVLDPPAGPGQGAVAGTSSVHVALTSFTGGVGGPLPGGFIPLLHVTVWNGPRGNPWLHISGKLQSDSDQDGSFMFWIPEPSTMALAGFGLMGLVAGMRRRRS